MRSVKFLRWFSWVVVAGVTACGVGPMGGPTWTVPRPDGGADARAESDSRPYEASPVVLGVLVPQSGSEYLVRYGELVLQGVRLAVERHEAAGGRPVELMVMDDRGEEARSAELLRRLEVLGAVGVVGPLMPSALEAAALARTDTALTIISPTAGERPYRANTYTLNAGDVHGAVQLAEYALAEGHRRAALLYPRSPDHRRQADAFRTAFTRGGGEIVAERPYEPGTTTFSEPILDMVERAPQVVFVPAPERDVRQLAPQLTYYGLTGAGIRVLGGEAWTLEAVRRDVSARYLEGVVATTPLIRTSAEVGWREFLDAYEQRFRRTLDSPFPALGHDAARLLLAAVDDRRLDAGVIASRLNGVHELRGATGVLGIEAGEVTRRPFLVRIERGGLVPMPSLRTGAPYSPDEG